MNLLSGLLRFRAGLQFKPRHSLKLHCLSGGHATVFLAVPPGVSSRRYHVQLSAPAGFVFTAVGPAKAEVAIEPLAVAVAQCLGYRVSETRGFVRAEDKVACVSA